MLKKILLVILILLMFGVIAFVILMGQGGKLFQGALYNLRPVYSECRIEGQNFQSSNATDCEEFINRLESGLFPDGEYTVFAKYADSRLPDNVIPVKISDSGKKMECTFLENGYQPEISVYPATDPLSSEALQEGQETPLYEQGTVVTVKFSKNGQDYVYDTNICEKSLQATVYSGSKTVLGTALLDHNGFINSRPLVHELLINNTPYYTDGDGNNIKEFPAGNLFLTLNFAPEIFFKLTIPCSKEKTSVYIPNIETSSNALIPFDGLNSQFLKTCGSRLYLSLQNTNRADDIQIIDDLNLDPEAAKPAYALDLSKIARVTDLNTTFPISFKISLHLRDRSDSTEIITLGSGLLTVKSYQTGQSGTTTALAGSSGSGVITGQNATPDNSLIIQEQSGTPDQSTEENRPRVRRTN
jgi:hypothetical protein